VLLYLEWLEADGTDVGRALCALVKVYELVPDPQSVRDSFVEQVTQRLADLHTALDQALGPPPP
jgi:hypothetical protein